MSLLLQLDLRSHATSHPRLGVVDHISVHALPPGGGATRDAPAEAHGAAAALALRLGGALAGPPSPLPVYYYGAASREGRALADVRRALGYFGANGGVSAAGGGFAPPPGAPPPDAGPEQATEAAGVRSFPLHLRLCIPQPFPNHFPSRGPVLSPPRP